MLPITYQKPSRDDWKGGMDAIMFSLDHQKSLNRSLLEIHKAAGDNSDPHVSSLKEMELITLLPSHLLYVFSNILACYYF